MEPERPGRGRGRRGTRYVRELDPWWQVALEAVPRVSPRPHVDRFLLDPHETRQLRVLPDQRRHLGIGEGVELFDPGDRVGLNPPLAPRLEERVIDLSRAKEEGAHPTAVQIVSLVENRLEAAAGELFQPGDGEAVAQEALRAHDDERLTEVALYLTAECMEQLSRRRQVADL